ncbi:MAG: hypothetical protein ABI209_10590 [Edaphobacter sp.]
MAIDQGLEDILDETIKALSDFDLAKLLVLEQRIAAIPLTRLSYPQDGSVPILSKKRQLEIILRNCETNLDALKRLHARNLRNQWAHQ